VLLSRLIELFETGMKVPRGEEAQRLTAELATLGPITKPQLISWFTNRKSRLAKAQARGGGGALGAGDGPGGGGDGGGSGDEAMEGDEQDAAVEAAATAAAFGGRARQKLLTISIEPFVDSAGRWAR